MLILDSLYSNRIRVLNVSVCSYRYNHVIRLSVIGTSPHPFRINIKIFLFICHQQTQPISNFMKRLQDCQCSLLSQKVNTLKLFQWILKTSRISTTRNQHHGVSVSLLSKHSFRIVCETRETFPISLTSIPTPTTSRSRRRPSPLCQPTDLSLFSLSSCILFFLRYVTDIRMWRLWFFPA